jgi:hypothetical protein
MKQLTKSLLTDDLYLLDVSAPICQDEGLQIAVSTSVISAGTESVGVEIAQISLLRKANARPDLV